MSGRYNDFDEDELDDDEELDDDVDSEGSGARSANNPFSSSSSGAAVRGAGLPATPAKPAPGSPSSGTGPFSSGQRPAQPGSASNPGSATAFGSPSGSPSRPAIPGQSPSGPSSGSGNVQPYGNRPPLGGSSPAGGSSSGQRPASTGGNYGSSAAPGFTKPGDPRPGSSSSSSYGSSPSSPGASSGQRPGGPSAAPGSASTSSSSFGRPAQPASSSRPDDKKQESKGDGGKGGLGGLFGRGGDKKDDKARPASASGKSSASSSGKSDSGKGGGLLGRFGRGGKSEKDSRSSAASNPMASGAGKPYGSSIPGSTGGSSSSGMNRPGSPSYGAASSTPGKSPAQPGKSSGKGGGAKAGLLATLTLGRFGGRKDSKPARTTRQGATVEVKPVSFARDKQFEIAGLILAISGIVLLLSSLSPVQGSIPQQVNSFLSSLFGWGAVVVPIVFVPMGIWLILIKVGQNAPVVALSRILGLVLLFISALVLMQFIDALSYPPGAGQSYDQYLAALQNVLLPLSSDFGRGGGRIGGTLYYQLILNFSEPGGFVILLGVLIVGLMLTLSVSAYEIAAIVIGSTRNLRDARRRRSTRITAERAAALALAGGPVEPSPALAAPATAKSAALPAGSPPLAAGTQPLPLEAPAQDRSIPILMGGRPLTASAETEAATLKPTGPAAPFPPLSPVPKPGDPAASTAVTPATSEGAAAENPAGADPKASGVFGRFKSALPAVGAATVLAAKSTVSAITPDKETGETAQASGEAKKATPFGKLFGRGGEAPAASSPPGAAATTTGTSATLAASAGPATPGATLTTAATVSGEAAKSAPVRFPLPASPLVDDEDDDLDVFDGDEFEDDEDDEAAVPPRLGDLLRPPAETTKPAATAASSTSAPAPSTSGVTPFSRPPLGTTASSAAAAQAANSSPAASEEPAKAAAESPKPAAAASTAAKPAAVTPPSPVRPPLKPAMPLGDDDDDWSQLPPARPRGALEPKAVNTPPPAPDKPTSPPPAPAAPEKRAPRPWETNPPDDAPPPATLTAAAKAADAGPEASSNGVSGAIKTGAAAVLGGMAAAAAGAFRAEPEPPKTAEAPKSAIPAPFSRTTASAPAQPTPTPAAPPPRAPANRPNWRLPDFTGLLAAGGDQEMNHDKLLARARTIEDTLASFGAPGRVVEVRTGPVITQFGVEPDYVEVRGKKNRVKVSAIANLDKDLQLSLGAKSIRIEAPVPGKGYVGIEVPNDKPSVVRLRDVMESNEFRRINSPLAIALGQGVDGTPVAADLGSMPHMLIAGTTGSGKSVCVNTIIASLLLRNSPERLKFIMVDPKRVELTSYNGIPHLVAPVVVELERVVSVLKWVTREMDERYRKYALAGARNIEDFNNHLPANEPVMPYIVVIIDELADLMMMAPDETEKVITRIAALARATGIHLVIATQRPSVDVVTGLIKANFPARVAFAVAGGVDSRVILDQPGAEKLLGKGDMLFMSGDTPAPARLQGVYVSDAEIGNITRYWRNQMAEPGLAEAGKPILSDFKLDEAAKQNSQPARGSGIGYGNGGRPSNGGSPARNRFDEDEIDDNDDEAGDDDDVLYEQAVETVRRLNKASVSLLQRRLRIGYTRAARLIDMMEERGVVGPAVEGSKPRDVLPIDKNRPN